jgi:hypothetical protein
VTHDTALVDGPWEPLSPTSVNELLRGSSEAVWWLAGGYALEMFAGHSWRTHDDIDVLLMRCDQQAIHEWLPDWQVYAAHPPGQLRRWESGDRLPPTVHDVWCRESADRPWRIQFMVDESETGRWISRRNHQVSRPVDSLGLTSDFGIPYLAPEIQLFYKAKATRPKDELDFRVVTPLLDEFQRDWLARALTATHPGHPWISRLIGRSENAK